MIYEAVHILLTKILRFKTPMLRSDLCDYSDTYIITKGTIGLGVDGSNDMTQKSVLQKILILFLVYDIRKFLELL